MGSAFAFPHCKNYGELLSNDKETDIIVQKTTPL